MYSSGGRASVAVLERGAGDDLVVDVGEVLDELHRVAAVLEVAADHIHPDEGASVADVGMELRRHAADVDPQHAVWR